MLCLPRVEHNLTCSLVLSDEQGRAKLEMRLVSRCLVTHGLIMQRGPTQPVQHERPAARDRICRIDGQAAMAGAGRMTNTTLPGLLNSDDPMLRLAVAAHLARYKGETRVHTASDLNCFLRWCLEHSLNPLEAERAHVELYLRWLQEVRRLKPSTVSRRLSVISTFYRTCVIDGVLKHSPAEYVRRPKVPPESPTLGLTHLQFEAMITVSPRLHQHQRLRPGSDAGAPRPPRLRGHRR